MESKAIENNLKNEHYPTDVKRLTKVYRHQMKRHCKNVDLILQEIKDRCKSGNGVKKEERFRDICQKHAETLYPEIGELAHAVPTFQIHASKTTVTEVGSSSILCSKESESDFRGLTSQRKVGRRFRALNRFFESSSTEKCMFIIIDYVTDNLMRRFYKEKPAKRPSKKSAKKSAEIPPPALEEFFKDSTTGAFWVGYPDDPDATQPALKRSNQDLIVLHEDKGVLFVQIKSVQKNNITTEEAMKKSITEGKDQLGQDVVVLRNCLRTFTPESVTKVLALPNLYKQDHDRIQGLVGKDVKLLLADHLSSDDNFRKWWDDLDKKGISRDRIKEIVGRYLGHFSTPRNLQSVNERHQVRDHCDVILFTGRLFKRLIFTQKQTDILQKHLDDKNQNVYISGPPGSGKTLMLIQRSKLFLSSSSNTVVVLDAYRGRKGRAVGRFIVENLKSDSSVREHRIEHLPLDINDKVDCQNQLSEIKERLKERQVMFIIDEIFFHPNWEPILKALPRQSRCFWCAGMDPEFPFKKINCSTEKLTSVLRCPPSVKKVLSQVDWEESRKSQASCYNAESEATERGTEGPIPLCIRHEKHEKYSGQKPIDCPKCAEELVDIFQKKMKLIHKTLPGESRVRLPCSIVILYSIPRNEYQNTEPHQAEITKTNFDKYSKTLSECIFLAKLKENLQTDIKVRTVLKFEEDFMKEWDEILFNWVDTFQGLERDVVVYLPGDEKISRSQTGEKRPIPGVQTLQQTPKESDTGKKSQTSTSQHHLQQHVETSHRELRKRKKSTSPLSHTHLQVPKHEHGALEPETTPQPQKSVVRQSPTKQVETSDRQLRNRVPSPIRGPSSQAHRHVPISSQDLPNLETEPEPQASTSQERLQSLKPQDRPETSNRLLRTRKRGPESPSDLQEPKPKKNRPESTIGTQSQASTSQQHSVRDDLGVASMTLNDDDIKRYSKWDQTNLFLAASRCCAQLIMIIP